MGGQIKALHMAHHTHTLAAARQIHVFTTACLRVDTSSKQQAIWGLDLSRVAGTLPVSMALMVGTAADIREVIPEGRMADIIAANTEAAMADTVVDMADMELDLLILLAA
ncbi:hypothetical protein IW147_002235 [Coemansia sp. RSA 720]|nr:hypothetical protein IW147_002235 [Coemansia sp. RSA 720]